MTLNINDGCPRGICADGEGHVGLAKPAHGGPDAAAVENDGKGLTPRLEARATYMVAAENDSRGTFTVSIPPQ